MQRTGIWKGKRYLPIVRRCTCELGIGISSEEPLSWQWASCSDRTEERMTGVLHQGSAVAAADMKIREEMAEWPCNRFDGIGDCPVPGLCDQALLPGISFPRLSEPGAGRAATAHSEGRRRDGGPQSGCKSGID